MFPARTILLILLLVAVPAWAGPDDAASLLADVGGPEDYPDANTIVVLDRTEVDVEPSGLSHVVTRRLTKVLTDAGARSQAFQRFDFDPATQTITVRRVTVHRAGGTSEDVDLAGLVDVTAPAHAIYWGARMLGLDLPRLRPGDAVEIETYKKGFQIAYLGAEGAGAATGGAVDESKYIPPMRGHYYDVILFQGTDPIIEKTYVLSTPRGMPVQYEVYNGEVVTAQTFDADKFHFTFSKKDVPAAKREWRSSGLSDYAPKVVLATVEDWGEKSRWFCEVNEGQFDATPEIQAKVDEITAGLKDDAAKISAINHWVAQNIRYCGFNMGQGEGYTLHPGDMVFRERAGVCKDIAGMSITMLRAAGYEVYPAMTMAGSRVEKTPADQFNHCVVALKQGDGYKMLDPTWVPFSRYDWSRSEGEQNYVVGSPEGEDLDIIRSYTPEENGLKLAIDARLSDDGTLTGKIAFDPSGNCDSRLRRAAGNTARDEIEPNLRHWLATLGSGAELVSYRFGDPEDWDRTMTLELEFRVPGYAAAGDETMIWAPLGSRLVMANYAWMFRWTNRNLSEDRETPALLWANAEVRLTETVELPGGFTATVPEAVKEGSAEGAGLCDFTWRADGRELKLEGRMVAAERTVTPETWPDFQAAVKAFAEMGDTRLVARTKGGRS